MTIRREAQELWLKHLRPDDRVLVTGAGGWFGRTAIAMTRESGLDLLATGSKDQQITIDNHNQLIHTQSFEAISAFEPTVVIDTAFLTRERLSVLGHKVYVETNQKLIDQSLAVAALASVRKYIGFSSGATMHLAGQASFSLEENPYAAQKRIYESRIEDIARSLEADISVARVWSVTGSHCTKPESFAFTDLISQAKRGPIEIKAKHLVYRRYCAVEDVLAVSMLPKKTGSNSVFNTGGDLVELGELAELIVELVNPNTEILRQVDPVLPSDDYHSDDKDWGELIKFAGLAFDPISNQIIRVAKGSSLKKYL
jgi:nucleoside-diphosphate-sugar epimerase